MGSACEFFIQKPTVLLMKMIALDSGFFFNITFFSRFTAVITSLCLSHFSEGYKDMDFSFSFFKPERFSPNKIDPKAPKGVRCQLSGVGWHL